MLESELEAAIRRYAQQKGCLFFKFTSPGKKGVPDRLLISPKGKVAFMEVKRAGKAPRPLQLYWLREFNKRKVPATYCDTLPQAIFFINALCAKGLNDASHLL
jgi:hypothetical protein